MPKQQECPYEPTVLKHRNRYFIYAVAAITIPIAACLITWWLGKPSSWITRSGSLMAIAAFMAHLQVGGMKSAFDVSMAGPTYISTRRKYFWQLSFFDKLAISLVILGTLVSGFGELLPLGSTQ